jgi:hypothetical protein
VTLEVDYPDRPLNRWTTALRILLALPIVFVLGLILSDAAADVGGRQIALSTGGAVILPAVLTIVFRRRYPRWWFDWNVELFRFLDRVLVYLLLMDDRYPSTEDRQSVHFEVRFPDVGRELNRGLPLIKWLLAAPHYLVLAAMGLAVLPLMVAAWVAILISGRYPRWIFDFFEGLLRWYARVFWYAWLMATDEYPPFRLSS